jgi:hypothetical protein
MAESYFQHAEHYFRIINAMNQAVQQGQAPQAGPQHGGQRRGYMGEGDGEQGQDGEDGEARVEARVEPRPEPRAPGTGDQPEAREIPIAAVPPEG